MFKEVKLRQVLEKQVNNETGLTEYTVKTLGYIADGMLVPIDPRNNHYRDIQEWIAEGNTPISTVSLHLEKLKDLKLQEIAYARWKEETGGLTLPDGTVVKTDRESQSLLMGAASFAKEDPTYTVNWKGATGWVTLDAATILQLAAAVRQHVQACFDKEKELTEKIMAATSIEELETIKWESN